MIYYLINENSYRHVTSFSAYFAKVLREYYGDNIIHKICNQVGDVTLAPGSLIYLVGEPFSPYKRTPGCKYVYLNFSVLYNLGHWWNTDFAGFRMMRQKRIKLRNKAPSIDYLLEYYPYQIDKVRKLINVPVRTFPVGINSTSPLPDYGARKYDIGFVGGRSPRRQALISEIVERGYTVSPQKGVVLEEVLAESRIALNVHKNRSLHLEIPRILGAFSTRSTVVTEDSHGMAESFPRDLYLSAPYNGLVELINKAMLDQAGSSAMAAAGYDWLTKSHLPALSEEWSRIFTDVADQLQFKVE